MVTSIDGEIRVRRIYDEPRDDDGTRVLVDRLWPRGVSREDAALDEWAKPVAPSDELRRWYDHDPDRFEEFRRRYRAELDEPEISEHLERLAGIGREGTLTLLTATKAVQRSHATVLAEILRGMS